METLVYITSEWMYDVDMGILKNITDKYQVHWFYLSNPSSPRVKKSEVIRYAHDYGIKIYWFDNVIKQLSPRKLLFYYRLSKVIEKIKPDVIIKVEQDFYWSIINKLFMKIESIYCVHDVLIHSGTHNRWIRQLYTNLTVHMNSNFITFSEAQKKIFMKRFKGKNVYSTHLSVKDFGSSSRRFLFFEDKIKLLFFGRIEYNKGLDILIKGLERSCQNGGSNIELSIYGKGSFWNNCKQLIKSIENYNLQIRYIDNEEIADLFCSHHFLVLPYRDTTQSGPLMIAANYGLPLFAADHESFREIYDNTNAIFYNSIDEGLAKLEAMDRQQYELLLSNSSLLKKKFSAECISNEIKEIIRIIMNKKV